MSKMVRGNVGVQVENDEGSLILSVREDVVSPKGRTGDNTRRRGGSIKLGAKGIIKRNRVNMVSTDSGKSRLSVSKVAVMNCYDSVREGLSMKCSDVSERLKIFSEVRVRGGGRDGSKEKGAGG